MNAILLTVFIGFVLVNLFVVLFLRYRKDAPLSSAERDSLLPLEEETWRPATPRVTPTAPTPRAH
jgi:cell division protein FtsN